MDNLVVGWQVVQPDAVDPRRARHGHGRLHAAAGAYRERSPPTSSSRRLPDEPWKGDLAKLAPQVRDAIKDAGPVAQRADDALADAGANGALGLPGRDADARDPRPAGQALRRGAVCPRGVAEGNIRRQVGHLSGSRPADHSQLGRHDEGHGH